MTAVKCGFTHGMVRPERHLYRQSLSGVFDNGDVVVKMGGGLNPPHFRLTLVFPPHA